MAAGEEWRPVEGWPYEVSSEGHVRRSGRARSAMVGRILKGMVGNHGYRIVCLSSHGRGLTVLVHNLVCAAFHGPRPLKHYAVHYDGNKLNNRADNLRWATPLQNKADGQRLGEISRGEQNKMALYTTDIVLTVRRLHKEIVAERKSVPKGTLLKIAEQTGLSIPTVRYLVRNKGWKHLRMD